MVRSTLLAGLAFFLPVTALAQDAPAEPDAGAMSIRLADMEHRMGALGEEIFLTRARLEMLLPDVSASGAARVRITHEDEMPPTYRLVRAAFAIDGAQVFVEADPSGLSREALEIYDGSIPAGEHVLGVELEYQGDGFGVFRYAEHYHFRVRSSHTFHAERGERLDLGVIGYGEGTPFVTVDDAPTVRFHEGRRPLAE